MTQTDKPIVKDAAKQAIDSLPGDANWDDVLYALYLLYRQTKGLSTTLAGEDMPRETVRDRLRRWSITGVLE